MFLSSFFGFPIALSGAKFLIEPDLLTSLKNSITGSASVLKGHGSPRMIYFDELYHFKSSNASFVYDIQVEDEPEFYANGILVHNCRICAPLHGRRMPVNNIPADLMIPQHTNCRCSYLPDLTNWAPPATIWTGGNQP